jgi:NADPH:quinone reductase-like Zn-dependent oxidoreductase
LWQKAPTILILGGSGGTGTTGLQLARAFGGSDANIITTTSADNFDYTHSLGANSSIDYKTSNWWEPSVVYSARFRSTCVYDLVAILRTILIFILLED